MLRGPLVDPVGPPDKLLNLVREVRVERILARSSNVY
jgi:hypothetical protein